MELKEKKVIILIENMYNEFEYWYPYYRLKEAGAQAIYIKSRPSCKSGYRCNRHQCSGI